MKPEWFKSSHSPNGGDCVEARGVAGSAEVRDSKNPENGTLSLPSSEWAALLRTAVRDR